MSAMDRFSDGAPSGSGFPGYGEDALLELPAHLAASALSRLLDGWDPTRRVLWADEALVGAARTLAYLPRGPWAVLIGPEGGWSPAERERLRALPFVTPISLGPRILRADTAAVAALALWQVAAGDWADAEAPQD